MIGESSGFFNAEYDSESDVWDRVYTSEQFADYFSQFIGNGVFGGVLSELQVRQHSNEDTAMDIRITPGRAYINGYWYYLEQEIFLDIDVNAGQTSRIDCVCLQYNYNDRTINAVYHNGTSQPIRNESMYELMLCTIKVKKDVVSISDGDITDTRLDDSVCGIVTGVIEQIDASTIVVQISSFIENFENESMASYNQWVAQQQDEYDTWIENQQNDFVAWITEQQNDFDAWFDSIKDILDESTAGHLQNEIDGLQNEINEIQSKSPFAIVNGKLCIKYTPVST